MYAPTNEVLLALQEWQWDVEEDCHHMWQERTAWEPDDFAEAAGYADLVAAVVRQMEQVAGRDVYVAVAWEWLATRYGEEALA